MEKVPVILQKLSDFVLKNNNHHLYIKTAAPCEERLLYKFLTIHSITGMDLWGKSKTCANIMPEVC